MKMQGKVIELLILHDVRSQKSKSFEKVKRLRRSLWTLTLCKKKRMVSDFDDGNVNNGGMN